MIYNHDEMNDKEGRKNCVEKEIRKLFNTEDFLWIYVEEKWQCYCY